MTMAEVTCNGRSYQFPKRPTVVICLDGSEPGYIEAAIEAGLAPTFARFMHDGLHTHAESVIPSFTNPNNLSIITGRPPAVHGIAGNFFYDAASGTEVMMNDPKFMRAPTILAAFHDAGAKVAMVTAKDKLRLLLSNGLDYASGRAIAFSAEPPAFSAEPGCSTTPTAPSAAPASSACLSAASDLPRISSSSEAQLSR